jgi:adenine deaminase
MTISKPAKYPRYDLTKVALGEEEADVAIVNGIILNVYTGETLEGDCVLIKGDKIAYVGKYAKRGIGKSTQIIDAAGRILIPGFIDGHTHTDYLFSSHEISRFAIKSGTTSIITEAAEISFRTGYRGICEFLKSTQAQPVKFWFTLPPMGTISPISNEHL